MKYYKSEKKVKKENSYVVESSREKGKCPKKNKKNGENLRRRGMYVCLLTVMVNYKNTYSCMGISEINEK